MSRKGPQPKHEVVQWLKARPELEHESNQFLAKRLKKEGFYSATTYWMDINIDRLRELAWSKE